MHILVSDAADGRLVEGRQLVLADEVPAGAVAVRYLVDGQELYGGPAPVGVAVPWATLGWHSGTHLLQAHALTDRSERLASASRTVWVANPIAVTSAWQACPRIERGDLSLKVTPAGSGLVKVSAVAARDVSQEEIAASVQQWGVPLRAAQRVATRTGDSLTSAAHLSATLVPDEPRNRRARLGELDDARTGSGGEPCKLLRGHQEQPGQGCTSRDPPHAPTVLGRHKAMVLPWTGNQAPHRSTLERSRPAKHSDRGWP